MSRDLAVAPATRVRTWTGYAESHAMSGRMLRLAARLAPSPLRPIARIPAPRLAPRARPLVSVVIPCYNYARFLPAAVRSAVLQEGVEVEVLVVDDVSTDDSLEVARRLAAEYPSVRVLARAENGGHVRAFNTGWAAASGAYIVKLDADDLLAAGSLARAAALLESCPGVGLVYGHPRHFESAEPPAGRTTDVRWTVWRGRDWLAERCRLGVSAITNPEMVLRSSVLAEIGPMDPAVPYAPDMEIAMRVAAVSDVGWVGGADQALHREHGGSMSETDGSGTLVDLEARADAFASVFRRVGDRVPGASALHDDARRALARDALRFASAAHDRGHPRGGDDELLSFAARIWPAAREWSSFQRVERDAASGPAARVAALARRAARRARQDVSYARWVVSGV
ncbi:glycosyltransferase family 2 protein [Microbacterium pygmaeum]|uniref:Glycosyl transferase family 2 n=1 Tax=Microbacterium pygmaeum TaxID=370764 RepID=A0A1G8DV46_9MICO|nr:glycosyltransferase family 2 protein [Microbacterium pygmaeum]SDH61330.1 Glycosyl transferase family 2 [Microbacterium pygmaeum]